MATLPKVLISRADYQIGGGVAPRLRTQAPPVSGWVLVVSSSLPYHTIETHYDIGKRFDVLFSRLMQRFDDVQFFGSHRGVGFVTWARALNGKPMRIFAFGEADVVANVGEQTPEETKLTFLDA